MLPASGWDRQVDQRRLVVDDVAASFQTMESGSEYWNEAVAKPRKVGFSRQRGQRSVDA